MIAAIILAILLVLVLHNYGKAVQSLEDRIDELNEEALRLKGQSAQANRSALETHVALAQKDRKSKPPCEFRTAEDAEL
jgi:F0F1-type ATP synthase membrane subunit b/b'